MARVLGDRFWSKVNFAGPVPEHAPSLGRCWLWLGAISSYGYGRFWVSAPAQGPRHRSHAHRVAYELEVGPIPDGLEPDHLCRVRACVNPAHIELVGGGENTRRGIGPSAENARKSHCVRGHDLAKTARPYRGHRVCRECSRIYSAAYRRRQRGLLETA